ncbi:Beta-glucuronosyltransferase [Vigna angularis]|uniref:Beta-glucuronosyltransferase n=1 Tax=Phaseolus angularis TaxID=3914 RepID=A0A8T0JZ19_PHAAN|nr:Beta-glucuronosyltransferase [Vigna angularis]
MTPFCVKKDSKKKASHAGPVDDFRHTDASCGHMIKNSDVNEEGAKEKLNQRARPIIIDPALYLSKKSDLALTTQRRTLPTSFKLFSVFHGSTNEFHDLPFIAYTQNENLSSSLKGESPAAAASSSVEKLKASNFPASLLRIASWKKPAAKNGSVTASAKKGKPAAAASSSDLSEESSDEDDVPKTKAVPAAAKNITSSNKKIQPSGSSDSDSDSSSDEDDKKKISATTKLPASSDDDSSEDSDEDDDVKPSATAVSKKKVDSFDSDDSSSDEDNKAAKKVSNAKSVPVSKQPVKTSSTSDSDEEVILFNALFRS